MSNVKLNVDYDRLCNEYNTLKHKALSEVCKEHNITLKQAIVIFDVYKKFQQEWDLKR